MQPFMKRSISSRYVCATRAQNKNIYAAATVIIFQNTSKAARTATLEMVSR